MNNEELANRLEEAREALGWTMREVSAKAGLKSDTHYGLLIRRLQTSEKARPSAATLGRVVKAFEDQGYREAWLVRGEEPAKSGAPTRIVERPHRYAHAPEVIQALIDDGYEPRDVRRAVGDIAFMEGNEGSSALDLYRSAKRVLNIERGRPELGVTPVEDDEF